MNTKLPIFDKKNEIVKSIEANDVTIITAETGSGKSTQVPQYLYEMGYEVICTQPRRIACVSLADRVSEEMKTEGNVVGYHIAFESTRTDETKVLFCTDGLQMAKQLSNRKEKNEGKTALIIDEVHEWNLSIETLIAWVRHEKKVNNSKLKVVLMSATVDSENLYFYFNEVTTVGMVNVPNRNYEVSWHMSDDYHNHEEIEIAVKCIKEGKNVLVFQPGKKEIYDFIKALKHTLGFEEGVDCVILPMHGELGISDQKACFRGYNCPKVVVSTNIAQTSITIDDIDVVIDTGSERVVIVKDGIEGLYLQPISKADCIQRAGRAGRTKHGEYYLCDYTKYSDRLYFPVPEIKRLMLDKVVLKLLSVGIDAVELEFFHQPLVTSLVESKALLKSLGAIDSKGNLTEIGKKISKLPISCRCGRMLVEAEKYGVVDEMITIISIIESGSLVNTRKKVQVSGFLGDYAENISYSNFTNESSSDLLAELEIYNKLERGKLGKTSLEMSDAGINVKAYKRAKELREMLDYVTDELLDKSNKSYGVEGILRSVVSAMTDNLYELRGICDEYCDHQGKNMVRLDKNSCITGYKRLIVGFPKVFEVNSRYGTTEMKLLQMASAVTADILLDYLNPESIEGVIDTYTIDYVPEKDTFIVDVHYSYGTIGLYCADSVCVTRDSELYASAKEIWDSVDKTDKRGSYVNICGEIKRVSNYWGKSVVDITFEELGKMKADGVSQVKTGYGDYVTLNYEGISGYNVQDLYDRVLTVRIGKLLDKESSGFPPKTGKLETIVGWFSELGKRVYTVEGMEKVVYIGLLKVGGSIKKHIFEDAERCEESNKECVEFLLMREVNKKYNDKTFKVINPQGKKVETKSTERAKKEFHDNILMVCEELSVTNFEESLSYLDDVYKELTEEMRK